MTILVSLFSSSARLRSSVLYGQPMDVIRGELENLALFCDDKLVLYQLVTRRCQTFLFRGAGTVSVPGVWPGVNLISHGANSVQSRKLVRSVLWLTEHGYDPQHVKDAVWLRISGLLNQEKYGVKQLCRLLEAQA